MRRKNAIAEAVELDLVPIEDAAKISESDK
jgi:hypothetical protein